MLAYIYNLATDNHRGVFASLVKCLLYLLSLVYWILLKIAISIRQINKAKLSAGVISVGNITLGGTGKTVVVDYIAKFLIGKGRKISVLTRGYKRIAYGHKDYNRINYNSMGDEAYMLKSKTPQLNAVVDSNRLRAARFAIKAYASDTLILDDGFQQRGIIKDLDIVTIDFTCPFGNFNLIPRGILREPLSSLKRADIFILTKSDLNQGQQGIVGYLNRINPAALIVRTIHHSGDFYSLGDKDQKFSAGSLQGKKACLFCGIACPDSFKDLIARIGIDAALTFYFPDHYHYSRRDLERIVDNAAKESIGILITTEKDAVRINGISFLTDRVKVLVMPVELKFISQDEEKRFTDRLLRVYSA